MARQVRRCRSLPRTWRNSLSGSGVLLILACAKQDVVPPNVDPGWIVQTSGTTRILYSVRFADGMRGIVVGGRGTVLRTVDGGEHWLPASVGTSAHLLGLEFLDPSTAVAVGGNDTVYAIYRTADGGATWTTQLQTNSIRYLRAVSFAGPSLGVAVGDGGLAFRSTDGGMTWTQQTTDTNKPLWGVYLATSEIGYAVGSAGAILRTADGGVSWSSLPPPGGWQFHGVHFTDAEHGFVVGTAGSILYTADGGLTWEPRVSGYVYDNYSVFFVTPQVGSIAAGGVILRTVDWGRTWKAQPARADGFFGNFGVHFASVDTGTIVGDRGLIQRTTSGGEPR